MTCLRGRGGPCRRNGGVRLRRSCDHGHGSGETRLRLVARDGHRVLSGSPFSCRSRCCTSTPRGPQAADGPAWGSDRAGSPTGTCEGHPYRAMERGHNSSSTAHQVGGHHDLEAAHIDETGHGMRTREPAHCRGPGVRERRAERTRRGLSPGSDASDEPARDARDHRSGRRATEGEGREARRAIRCAGRRAGSVERYAEAGCRGVPRHGATDHRSLIGVLKHEAVVDATRDS